MNAPATLCETAPANPSVTRERLVALSGDFELANGQRVHLRWIRPEDEPAMVEFHRGLSPETVFLRYFHLLGLGQRAGHAQLQRFCAGTADGRETILLAECLAGSRDGEIAGVGQLIRLAPRSPTAEFALLVGDDFQGCGLGSELLRRLLIAGREAGLQRVVGYVLRENGPMLGVCRKLGLRVFWDAQQEAMRAECDLASLSWLASAKNAR